MKKFLIIFLLGLLMAGCGEAEKISAENNQADEKKILVAYFSRADENYNVGTIEKGNTKIVAEKIAEKVGGDMFEIKPAKTYPANYQECTEVAKIEFLIRKT